MRPGGSTLLPCEMRTMCGSDVPGGTRRRGTGQGRAGPLCCVPPSRGRTAQPARYRLMAVRRSRDGRDPFGLRLSRRALCSPTSRLCGQRVKSSEGWKEAAEFQQRRKKKKKRRKKQRRGQADVRGKARLGRGGGPRSPGLAVPEPTRDSRPGPRNAALSHTARPLPPPPARLSPPTGIPAAGSAARHSGAGAGGEPPSPGRHLRK